MDQVQNLYTSGLQALRLGDGRTAEAIFRQVLDFDQQHLGALNVLSIVLVGQKRFDEAETLLLKALKKAPAAATFHNYGTVLLETGRTAEALVQFEEVIALNSLSIEAWFNKGLCLKRLHRIVDGLEALHKCLEIDPKHESALYLKGDIHLELGSASDALECFILALQKRSDFAEALHGCGRALIELRRMDEALLAFDDAIRINPRLGEAFFGRGLAFARSRKFKQALIEMDRATSLCPESANLFSARASVRFELELFSEAVEDWERALELDPSSKWLHGNILHAKRQMCDWADHEKQTERLIEGVCAGSSVVSPFYLLALSDSRRAQRKSAEIWARGYRCSDNTVQSLSSFESEKIRIGYFSADFHDHATMFLLGDVFELHDRNKFEIFAFSWGPVTDDEQQRRVKEYTTFFDVSGHADEDVAKLARTMRIDIAVDLKGYTKEARPKIFAYGPAPVTVNYLGYPGTMGSDHMNYMIVDPILIPPEHRQSYSEKSITLPHCYQPNSRRCLSVPEVPSRSLHGLPENGFIFCCFNNSYKISPQIFSIWMDILHATEGSVLWLYEQNKIASSNLRKEAALRGISPSRLVFARHLPIEDHLARIKLADLALDTAPYNAHTTASDVLWAGVPMLTRIGNSFVSRVGASLLTAVGLPDLITQSDFEYRDLAIQLSKNPLRLAEIRKLLKRRVGISPLFDMYLYTRHLEQAFEVVHVRQRAGLDPDHVSIEALSSQL